MNARPIGVFDSGIGGLTVANAIKQLVPNEQLVYFGDTAHLPYGEKSPDSIRYYSLKIGNFLAEQDCKAIVIACNTASAYAYKDLQDVLGKRIPIINVIDPVVQHIAHDPTHKQIGVIATKATIRSDMYAKKLRELKPDLKVASLATPLLVPMIEEGFFNNTISKAIIHAYLDKPKLKKIDSLILACTHYPLIRKEIEQYYNGRVYIVDSAEIVARYVKQILEMMDLLHGEEKAFQHRFYVSDLTPSFEQSTKIFFKEKIELEHKNIWSE